MDYKPLFADLNDASDVWVYVSTEPLSDDQSQALLRSLATFSEGWSSHGRAVHAGYQIIDSQILNLGAWIDGGDISGCGIDKSLHLIDGFAATHGFSWLDALSVVYRNTSNQLKVVSRPAFRQLVRNQTVTAETIVLDPTLRVLSDIRAGMLEKPASESWHSMVFQIPQLTAI